MWQPISTAPRNGDIIWLAGQHSLRLGFWRNGEEYEVHGSKGGGWADFAKTETSGPNDLSYAPTHWQPVPKLPTQP